MINNQVSIIMCIRNQMQKPIDIDLVGFRVPKTGQIDVLNNSFIYYIDSSIEIRIS